MTLEQRVESLEHQMRLLQNATIQASKNALPQTEKLDETASKVVDLTPYTDSKTAYIDDTSVTFEDVPDGNMSVYVGGTNYSIFDRDGDNVVVKFEPLEEVSEVSISII